MNHLEIKHLRMIRSIAETGNMTKSADRLFLSQSALSQQLKDIESKLNIDIFFRTPKMMILTATGKKLLKTAEHVIDTLEDAELEIAKIVSGDKGELKVGTQCIFCYKWLPQVMRIFQKKFPNIDFEIGNSYDIPQELESKRYDLIITAGSKPDDTYAVSRLFKDQLVCILPQDHSLSAQPSTDFQDFRKIDLISHAEKAKNKFYLSFLKPKGIEPRRFMTVGQPQAIIEMVASGFGASVFPRWAVKTALPETEIVARPITRKGLPVTWYAVSLRNINAPLFLNEFINIVGKMNLATPA
jgi:LysR family transcriptional regulator, regulator for metE and metH